MAFKLMKIEQSVILGLLKQDKTSTTGTKRMNAMSLRLLTVLIVLFLSACATTSTRGDSPASDLDALEANVNRDLRMTLLPNGKQYCAELATTEREQDECMGDLEDALFNSNRDKQSARQTLGKGIKRLKLARDPCRWWEFRCKREARALDREP